MYDVYKEINMKIAFINCSKEKRKGTWPAGLIYDESDLFKKSKSYVKSQAFDQYYILSAKFGLLHPEDVIESYNVALKDFKKAELMEWASKVNEQLKERVPDMTEAHFYTSEDYCRYLIPLLEGRGIKVTRYLEGLSIGRKLSWYKNNTPQAAAKKGLFELRPEGKRQNGI